MSKIIVLGVLIIIIIGVYTVINLHLKVSSIAESKASKDRSMISFKESLDLTSLPIVTFEVGKEKFNFLLDTGSDVSYINENLLPKFKHVKIKENPIEVIGIEGNPIEVYPIGSILKYKEMEFKNIFYISDLERAFSIVKNSTGVQIHGILGSLFFQNYKYVLDFNDLIAYSK